VKTLVIVGAGGHGLVCADIAERVGGFDNIVFSDGAHERDTLAGRWVVEFHDEDLSSLNPATYEFVLGVGQIGTGHTRETIFSRVAESGLAPASLTAPNASVSRDSIVGPGTLIGFISTVNIGATIGTNVIVNTRAVIEHDAVIGDHVHISTGAIVNGGAKVGHRCLIGSSTTVLQGVSICDNVIVGAGAVVTGNIDSPGTYVGVPARKIHD
jgi:sugar O-acyltransferase (sialic acid O-acetyltransferase NeuD family)